MAVLLVHCFQFSGVSRVLHHVLVHHAHLLPTHSQVGYAYVKVYVKTAACYLETNEKVERRHQEISILCRLYHCDH